MKPYAVVFVALWTCVMSLPYRSMACACCADSWYVGDYQRKFSDDELFQLSSLKYTGKIGMASFGESDAMFEFGPFYIEGQFINDVFLFKLIREKTYIGNMKFKFLDTYRLSRTDTRYIASDKKMQEDDRQYQTTILYDQIRVDGVLEANDIAKKFEIEVDKKATLILHATGGRCWNDPSQWSFSLTMRKSKTEESGFGHGSTAFISESDRARVANDFGMRSYRKNDYSVARRYFSDAVSRDPTYYIARTNLASTLSLLGIKKEAIAQLQKAFTIDPQQTIKKMKKDKDYDNIRNEPEFKEILQRGG